MSNWIHHQQVGKDPTTSREAYFDLDEVVFIEVQDHVVADTKIGQKMFIRFKQDCILNYDDRGRPYRNNQWVVYDEATQNMIRNKLEAKKEGF